MSDYIVVRERRSACPICGTHDRSGFHSSKMEAKTGKFEGKPYTHVRSKRTTCNKCQQRYLVQELLYLPDDEGEVHIPARPPASEAKQASKKAKPKAKKQAVSSIGALEKAKMSAERNEKSEKETPFGENGVDFGE